MAFRFLNCYVGYFKYSPCVSSFENICWNNVMIAFKCYCRLYCWLLQVLKYMLPSFWLYPPHTICCCCCFEVAIIEFQLWGCHYRTPAYECALAFDYFASCFCFLKMLFVITFKFQFCFVVKLCCNTWNGV